MELEFDNEIDALLRRTRSPSTAGMPSAGHLDADELAAFAENALPERARQIYMVHLADCDSCRMILSAAIDLAPEIAVPAAAAPAQLGGLAEKLPWYRRVFRMPELAYVVGGLVVVFSGMIGLVVYQNRSDSGMQLSQVNGSEPVATAPATREAVEDRTADSRTNTMSNSTASPIESVTRSGVAVGSTNSASSPTNAPADEKTVSIDGLVAKEAPAPSKVDAPAPIVTSKPAEERELSTERMRAAKNEDKDALDDRSGNRIDTQSNNSRDMTPGALSAKRAEGPRQAQSQINQQQMAELPRAKTLSSLRTAGGKKFELRDGIWYDTAYTGQSKRDVKRGTEKYIRLDAGLRNIADEIGGTVVIVWNGQAFRIK